jgi:predicted nucleic acid-binding Zn ribbon protein
LHEVNSVQERHETSKKVLTVAHTNHERYIVNLHALHNGLHLRKVLPRNLTAPIPWSQDRYKLHNQMSQRLQKENPGKRAEAAAKAKATRDQKKKAG